MDDVSLARRLWQANADWAAKILAHPFVQGLGDGSLATAAFKSYVAQDAYFLDAFARGYGGSTIVYTGTSLIAPRRVIEQWAVPGIDYADLERRSGGASLVTWGFAGVGGQGRIELILRRRAGPFDPVAARSVSL